MVLYVGYQYCSIHVYQSISIEKKNLHRLVAYAISMKKIATLVETCNDLKFTIIELKFL